MSPLFPSQNKHNNDVKDYNYGRVAAREENRNSISKYRTPQRRLQMSPQQIGYQGEVYNCTSKDSRQLNSKQQIT